MEQPKVIIVGTGPAGLSAALYFARSGMHTTVFGDGRTQLHSILLNNTYLGIQEPMLGDDFYTNAIEQVKHVGVQVKMEKVTAFREVGEQYEVVTESGSHVADYILLSSGVAFDTAELFGVELEENQEPYIKKRIKVDERGRTSKRNIYAAGIAAGTSSQAIIAAGNGAQVALNLISDREDTRICYHDRKPKPETVS
ncbi:MAG: FAD-dependent oxidoreductase [Tumebacillaceae bacterium]